MGKNFSHLLLALGIILAGFSTSCAHAQFYASVGPPAMIVERPGPPPGATYVWVPGYYRWTGGRYIWVPGHYVLPPRPYYHRWVPGRWARGPRGWYWREGHWARG